MLPWKGVVYSVEAMATIHERFPDAVLILTDTDDIVDWIDELKGYEARMKARLDDRLAGIEKLKTKLAKVAADRQGEHENLLQELPDLYPDTRRKLRDLGRAPDESWGRLRERMDASWSRLDEGYREAARIFGEA